MILRNAYRKHGFTSLWFQVESFTDTSEYINTVDVNRVTLLFWQETRSDARREVNQTAQSAFHRVKRKVKSHEGMMQTRERRGHESPPLITARN